MKLATISLLSATIGVILCWSAMKTAQEIARISLDKQQTVVETTP